MTQFDKMIQEFDQYSMPYAITQIWDEYNQLAGYAIWLSTCHFEFDLFGRLDNFIDY